jgi:hypothetical protein
MNVGSLLLLGVSASAAANPTQLVGGNKFRIVEAAAFADGLAAHGATHICFSAAFVTMIGDTAGSYQDFLQRSKIWNKTSLLVERGRGQVGSMFGGVNWATRSELAGEESNGSGDAGGQWWCGTPIF